LLTTTLADPAALALPMVTEPKAREVGLTLPPARSGRGKSMVRTTGKHVNRHTHSVLRISI